MSRAATILLASLGVLLGAIVLYDDGLRGFPDGHLTEYDRFMRGPSRAIGVALVLFPAIAAAAWLKLRSQIVPWILAALIASAVVGLAVVLPRLGAGLDDGQGG